MSSRSRLTGRSRGKIVIISSPSGGGKTSICRKLLSPARRRKGWRFSVSYTTRSPRPGERNGREYYFVDDSEFARMEKKNLFAESCRVHLYRYGTPCGPIDKIRRSGGVMVFDVDVKGARKLREKYSDAIAIFVLPPSISALKERLRIRGTENAELRRIRLENALREMKTFREYKFDYVVINQYLDRAVRQVLAIVEAHHCRIDRTDMEQIRRIVG